MTMSGIFYVIDSYLYHDGWLVTMFGYVVHLYVINCWLCLDSDEELKPLSKCVKECKRGGCLGIRGTCKGVCYCYGVGEV